MIVKSVIERGGRYLIAKRMDADRVWDLPGGHVEPGESPEEALTRELREELGVSGRVGELVYEAEISYPGVFYVFKAYMVEDIVGEIVLTEHEGMEWVDPSEFDGYNIYPDFRECLRAVTGV